ncbi:MAG: DUF3429 domain-containing protein [Gammaproteobacteria bacterium]|nr:DUF3429 domain-containing protein [Gammaproteobacteria bacterium]
MHTLTAPAAPTPAHAPRPAILLGFGGLIPFVGLALLAARAPAMAPPYLAALETYAAVILSFVGALHWGYAVRTNARGPLATLQYIYSVLPSLAGWFALHLATAATLRVQAATFVACFVADLALAEREALPRWFLRLRAALTTVAAASLVFASGVA